MVFSRCLLRAASTAQLPDVATPCPSLCRQLTQVLANDPDRPALLFETTGCPQTIQFYLPNTLWQARPGPVPLGQLVVLEIGRLNETNIPG